jgi:4-hydroxy-tetrahydrodipicolinate synthase
MSTERLQLEGSMVAIVTPFSGENVDYDVLGKLIEFQIEGGTQGLVPCGTTGESPTLSHDEHDRVIEFVVDKTAGRVPVIAGTGSNSTAEAVRLTQHAKAAGADACLSVNPYYNKPPQRGMIEHTKRMADAELPIVLYNIPGRTSIELTAESVAHMYEEIPHVVAVKEATGKLDLASAIASMCDITILSGDDSLTLPLASVGGKGVVSVLANIMPREVRTLCDHIAANDPVAARAQHLKLFPLCKAMFCETNPIPIKAAMAMAGLCDESVRLPLMTLDNSHRAMLKQMLEIFGVPLR